MTFSYFFFFSWRRLFFINVAGVFAFPWRMPVARVIVFFFPSAWIPTM
jgi:hypothetical protein